MENKLTPEQIAEIREARKQLWYKGILAYKLDDNQKFLYKMYKETDEKILVWNMARGSGKSFMLCIIAIEECLKNPKALVKYACPKQKDAREIIHPIFRDIIEDCPEDIKPKFVMSKGAWVFPNGAQIQLSGLDNGRAESLRGGSAVLCIVDEAGSKSLKDLKYIVRSILLPVVTRKKEINGKIILASTPPLSNTHPYIYFLRRAELNGASATRTIFTNPRMTPEMIAKLIDENGGEESPDWKREFLCQIVKDEASAVVPEFTEELEKKIVKVWPKPPFYDAYVAMDLGLKDFTVVLFAYIDFKANKLIIEDELVLNGQKFNTEILANGIKKKERLNFYQENTGDVITPYKRVSDNDLMTIQDLYQLHQLEFHPTRKDDADLALNNMRIMIASGQIIINPRCEVLIRHLRDAIWTKSKKTYERSPDDGHYDAVDSLKYLVRNIDLKRNPYPKWYGVNTGEGFFVHRDPVTSGFKEQVKSILNMRRK
jgi:hypothetical protein